MLKAYFIVLCFCGWVGWYVTHTCGELNHCPLASRAAAGEVLAGGCGVAGVSARDAADEAAAMLGGDAGSFEAGANMADDNGCIKVMPKLRRRR